ncbi:chondroitin synthase [mine drainage metagenome]|uniref:Chondroitin synthase n=1 Tax=mine drainage metagenome TaxID=410659 RepID=A0A1J5RPC1_9ZZZZ
MTAMPTISVVIPTFNSADYLGGCLASIALQRDPALEVIVIDGGSSDGTAEIVAAYAGLVSHFISEPDRGQGDAVTKGLRLARGDISHWHAADDIVLPGAFSSVRSAFAADARLGLVISDGIAFDEHRLVHTGKCRWNNYRTSLFHFARFQSDCAYWRSSLTAAALPLDITQPISVDEDFFLRLWRGHQHRWLDRPLGAFRLREGQLSGRLSRERLQADRRRTREAIFARDGLGPGQVALWRAATWPEHFMRNVALPAWRGLGARTRRAWLGGERRQGTLEVLSGFVSASDRDSAARYFDELGLRLARGWY